jgi:hypothetical protein
VKRAADSSAVARFTGCGCFTNALLGLTSQALCFRLLRRLKTKVLKHPYKENAKKLSFQSIQPSGLSKAFEMKQSYKLGNSQYDEI